VTLAPALQGHVAPDDTLFVFARAVNGSRMPLAVLRKQVKDLPLRFTLDDSLAMSPAAKLSGAASVVVGARISKSGKAGAQEGDLQGHLPAVALGTGSLKLEINEVVKTR
jgi:cytochrome c-type biogenesis protein CcmH